MTMARNEQEIRREIQRLQGQLLVAKQICRENLEEINQLKEEQNHDEILRETHRLLTIKSLHSDEHRDQFNQLLRKIAERQQINLTIDQPKEQTELLVDLSSNVTQMESLFQYAQTLCTQPITSINMLNNTVNLDDLNDQTFTKATSEQRHRNSIDVEQLQKRIDQIQEQLMNIDQDDRCLIQ